MFQRQDLKRCLAIALMVIIWFGVEVILFTVINSSHAQPDHSGLVAQDVFENAAFSSSKLQECCIDCFFNSAVGHDPNTHLDGILSRSNVYRFALHRPPVCVYDNGCGYLKEIAFILKIRSSQIFSLILDGFFNRCVFKV